MLGLTEEQLDGLPIVSFDCLKREDVVITDSRVRGYFGKENIVKKPEPIIVKDVPKTTLGDLFGDILAKFKEDLED